VALIGGAALWFWNSRPGATGSVETISQELRGATQAEVSISPGVGRLDLGSLEDNPTSLLEGRIELLPGERLEKSSNMRGGTAVVKIATKGSTSGFRRQSEGWNLRLSPKIPISLRVNLGAGESQLNLRELKLSGLNVGSGVGRVEVDLPRGSYSAKVSGGVGEVVVNLPGEAAVRLSANAGLGGVDVPDGLVKTGDKTYESRNYSEATNRIILEVSGGVGKVEVNQ